jgi:DnaJ-class molecular chaperone
MEENYYNILGILKTSTQDEIKKAYRKMQMKWHPDRNPGSQEAIQMTQKINEAYETLGNEKKREEYDNPNPFTRFNNSMEVPVDDLLNMFFGGGGMGNPFGVFGEMGPGISLSNGIPLGARIHVFNGHNGLGHNGLGHNGLGHNGLGQNMFSQKPPSITKTLQISIEQVLTGATIPIEIERWVVENGIKIHEQETIYVSVPQGIDDGEIILLKEKGNVMNEKSKGDIKIAIKIINNTAFKRSGLDLILEKNISLKESLCGFSFEIIYLNGKSYTLNNNKGNIIPPEYKKVYSNMGLTRENHRGNLIIHFHVNFPEILTKEQITSLEQIL